MQKKTVPFLIILILVGGVLGSAFSLYLSGLFPEGQVKKFFFEAIKFGIPNFTINLGFLELTFGFSLAITAFTALFIIFLTYLILKL
jgi:hypothetical protein|uniref:DUF4321 domain-containing protein n=1 Tax=candidate division WOR-3 bacterium TaxID=2052148 RepID=A0A7V5Y014_UNCW3